MKSIIRLLYNETNNEFNEVETKKPQKSQPKTQMLKTKN